MLGYSAQILRNLAQLPQLLLRVLVLDVQREDAPPALLQSQHSDTAARLSRLRLFDLPSFESQFVPYSLQKRELPRDVERAASSNSCETDCEFWRCEPVTFESAIGVFNI